MVALVIMNPQDFCECFGLENNVDTKDKLNGNGFNQLVGAGWNVFVG